MQTECPIEILISLDRKNAKNFFMKKDTTTGFIKSFLLFGIAFVLVVTTTPIGFLYALLRQLFVGKIKMENIHLVVVLTLIKALIQSVEQQVLRVK